jgi:hypothetical protein
MLLAGFGEEEDRGILILITSAIISFLTAILGLIYTIKTFSKMKKQGKVNNLKE